MATLRYIAYLANEPEKLTEFYGRFLGTEELGRSAEGDISITDGHYNLPFQVIGVLILVATVGVIVLSKRQLR